MGLVLAVATALHVGRDHIYRRRDPDPVVHCREHKRLGAPARRAGAADPVRVHARKGLKEVDDADAVPQLQPQDADSPEVFGTSAEFPMLDLAAVVIPRHVVRKNDMPLAGQVDAASRNGTECSVVVLEATAATVAVRAGNTRVGSRTRRAIEVATYQKTG